MIATRRVANRLAGQGLSASILTAAQITAATGHLAHGADTGEVREDWDAVTSDRLRMCTYAVDPDHLDAPLGGDAPAPVELLITDTESWDDVAALMP